MKPPLIVVILGGVLLLISLAVFVISLLVPIVNAGHASWDEAMWGIIPGGCCSCVSGLVVVGGIVWWAMSRAK